MTIKTYSSKSNARRAARMVAPDGDFTLMPVGQRGAFIANIEAAMTEEAMMEEAMMEEHVKEQPKSYFPTAPREGPAKERIWGELDRLWETGELQDMRRSEIVDHLEGLGMRRATSASQYQAWRKYHGLVNQRTETIRGTVEHICQEELELHGPEDLRRKHVIDRTRQLGITDGTASIAWHNWKKANLEPLLELLGTEDEEG